MTAFEKIIDQLRGEKEQLRNVFSSQEQNMKIELLQEQQKTSQELKELRE